MKQIIVNVDGLTNTEKKRVSEALAKIKNIRMCNPLYWYDCDSLYGPSCSGGIVGFDYIKSESPTHTPQHVLAMAGMEPDIGVSVKLDKNGVAVMAPKRKVRTGFDKAKQYTVDVSECTVEEKKEVQQAFFDVGIPWEVYGNTYRYLEEVKYTNTRTNGHVTAYCMFGVTTADCNMTAKEFLDLVYEPEQQGYVHADLILQFGADAQVHTEPWKLWQFKVKGDVWCDCPRNPHWKVDTEYRRKPKTHTVNGVEIPDLRVTPEHGENYYIADPASRTLFIRDKFGEHVIGKLWVERGLTYQHTEEGKQAAILHSQAMLGMVQE